MQRDKLCKKIIEDNYAAIFRFCNVKLSGDHYGAEECTQEVFLLFLQRKDELDLQGRIDRWLIAAASRLVKKYMQKKSEQAEYEMGGVEDLPDRTEEPIAHAPVLDVLTDEEYDFLTRYYSMDRELRKELADELGIPVNALYQRIFVLKNKINKTNKEPPEWIKLEDVTKLIVEAKKTAYKKHI